MRPPRLRDVWCFTRPAGVTCFMHGPSTWRCAEGWTVWVLEEWDASYRPYYMVGARMWGQLVCVTFDTYEWQGPKFTVESLRHTTLHAARVNACSRVLTLSGSMSAEGFARRCPAFAYHRDGKPCALQKAPWQWDRDP